MAVTAHEHGREWRYPTSEVRGRSPEDPCPRAKAKKGYPVSEVRGSDPECQAETAGMGQRSSPTSEVRGSGPEEQPHVQIQGGG